MRIFNAARLNNDESWELDRIVLVGERLVARGQVAPKVKSHRLPYRSVGEVELPGRGSARCSETLVCPRQPLKTLKYRGQEAPDVQID